MSATVDPNQRFVQLEGTSLSLFVTSIAGGILSLLAVGGRTLVRLKARTFGWDDGLMLAGLVSSTRSNYALDSTSSTSFPEHSLTFEPRSFI